MHSPISTLPVVFLRNERRLNVFRNWPAIQQPASFVLRECVCVVLIFSLCSHASLYTNCSCVYKNSRKWCRNREIQDLRSWSSDCNEHYVRKTFTILFHEYFCFQKSFHDWIRWRNNRTVGKRIHYLIRNCILSEHWVFEINEITSQLNKTTSCYWIRMKSLNVSMSEDN